jgi:hypothetical protein
MLPGATQAISLAGACVLMVAGFAKLLDQERFVSAVTNHGIVPSALAGDASRAFIMAELAVATGSVWALLTRRPALAGWLLAAVFAVFSWYAAALVVFPPPAPAACGCGVLGGSGDAHWPEITARNVAAALLLGLSAKFTPTPPPSPRSPR